MRLLPGPHLKERCPPGMSTFPNLVVKGQVEPLALGHSLAKADLTVLERHRVDAAGTAAGAGCLPGS